MEKEQVFENRLELSELKKAVELINNELKKIIVGQEKMIDLLIAALLADGHVLIEGVPGIAKTLTAKLMAKTISAGFSRIQFTPDLMPSDVIGTSVFNMKKAEFEFNKGPVFSNMILIDEINRAPAKTQSALLEVMEERQVTVDGTTYLMDKPYMVLATQNPIEHEGTYKLPEAQLDRFLFKIQMDYPSFDEETIILSEFHGRKHINEVEAIKPVLTKKQVIDIQQKVNAVYIDKNLIQYITQIVHDTRNNNSLYLGGSPRASLAIMIGAKAIAAMQGRDFINPEDIREVTLPALRHRILLTPEKEMEGVKADDVIRQIVEKIEVPR